MQEIREFFSFTRRERSGVLALILLCLAMWFLPEMYRYLRRGSPVEEAAFPAAAGGLDSAANSSVDRKGDGANGNTVTETAPELFPFDPNRASLSELLALGIAPRVAQTLINYRKKGGVFRQPGDLERIYGLEPEILERLLPFIRIPEDPEGRPAGDPGRRQEPAAGQGFHVPAAEPGPVLIDINQATPDEWQRLYGIGPVLSARIVRFRDKLGGFASADQLAETYGLPDSTFQRIRQNLAISPVLRKLAVNRLGWRELAAHPYLNERQAQAIERYRLEHGRFTGTDDLVRVRVLPAETLEKLSPYFSFE